VSVERTNKIYVWIGLGFLLTLPLFYLDFSPKDNIELRKAIAVVRYMSAPRQLKRSAFQATYPEGSPKQFVNGCFLLWDRQYGRLLKEGESSALRKKK